MSLLRSQRERQSLADLITGLLEDAVHYGTLSRKTVEDFYFRAGHNCGLPDLLHPKLQRTKQQVEEGLRDRLNPKQKEPSAMTTKGVIVESKVGHTIPTNELKTLLNRYPNSFGYATIDEGKMMLGKDNDPEEVTFDKIDNYNQILKDHYVLYYFGRGEVKQEDLQPFVVCSDQGLPKIVCFVEGNFTNFADANGRTDESNFMQDYLQQKIDYLHELCEDDVERTMKQFENKITGREIVREFGDKGRGVIYLMGTVGNPTCIELNELRKDFEWGSVSDMSELTNATKIGTSVPASGGKEMTDTEKKIAELRARKAARAAQPDGVHTTDATPKPLAPLQEDLQNAAALEKKDLIFPPKEVFSHRNNLKDWLNKNLGTCPDGYKLWVDHPEKCPGFPRSMFKPGSEVLKVKSLTEMGTALKGAGASAEASKPDADKDTSAGGFPIIPAGQKEQVAKLIGNADMKGKSIMDPKKIQKIEAVSSTFYDQFGVTPEDTFQWKDERILELCRKFPDTAQLWIMSLLHFQAIALMNKKKKEEPSEQLTETQKKIAELKAKKAAKAS